MRAPLRVGVVGIGHLGARHAQVYATLPGVRLSALCDADRARARRVARPLRCDTTQDIQQLIGRVDAVSLAVPTSLHFSLAQVLLDAGIHVLVEKPIATTLPHAERLIRTARRRRCVLQIGHIERFNAAIQAAIHHLIRPRFIEVHRLSPYPFRGTDVSVVLDVMIHDLDVILSMVRSRPSRIQALGVSVLSESEDIASARVRFASGCVANLTASRVSDETVRRIRVFQEDRYLSIDYQAQTAELALRSTRGIRRVALPVNRRPPLNEEIASFVRSIVTHRPPAVSGAEGKAALAFALRIEQAIRRHRS